jgi:transcriptional regulator with XRE-family HTH domain
MSKITAERLIRLRGKASLADVARIAGVNASTISNWENWESAAHAEPKADALGRLARHWNVTTDYLCGVTDYPTPLPASHWVIDLDRVDVVRAGGTPPDDGRFAWPVPQRHRVISSVELEGLRQQLFGRKKGKTDQGGGTT